RRCLHPRWRPARRGRSRGDRDPVPTARGAVRRAHGQGALPAGHRAGADAPRRGSRRRGLRRLGGLNGRFRFALPGRAGLRSPVAQFNVTVPGVPPMPDQEAILEALRSVKDPELNLNVVDLGLVYTVQTHDEQVDVEMTLTSPACPAGPEILR